MAGLISLAAVLTACGGAPTSAPPASSGSKTKTSPSTAASSSSTSSATSASSGTVQKSSSTSKPLTQVTLRLDWIASGYQAPWVVASDNGYYKAAGLDVKILQGKGSATCAETVGNGSDTFGACDSGTAAKLISKGDPIKVLAVWVQQSPMGFEYNPPFKLTNARQLLGKTLITSSGSASNQILGAVVGPDGIKKSQLKLDFVSPSAFPTILKRHPSYVVLGWVNTDYQRIQKIDPKARATSYAQLGVNTLNIGTITSLNEIKDHPNVVRSFLAASVKGWNYAIKHPQTAVNDLVKQFPKADPKLMLAGWQKTLTMLHTKNTQGKPVGWMSKKDWQQTINLLHQYAGMKNVKPLNAYYTNQYLPQ